VRGDGDGDGGRRDRRSPASQPLSFGYSLSTSGGGASRLVDNLLRNNFGRLTVLDLAGAALDAARERLGESALRVTWLVADVTTWQPSRTYDLWHDRAAFHFLTEQAE
jgi:trans-aconitate methyltransferase